MQNDTLGHRGHKDDPLYRCRRLLTKADERLDEKGREKLVGFLDAGDPRGEVPYGLAREGVVREIYTHTDPVLAAEFVQRLGHHLQDQSCPIEFRRVARTLLRWQHQITNWHRANVTNAPTEARVGFGFRKFTYCRVRALLYAGKPNWDLLATITPRKNPKTHIAVAASTR